MKINAGTLIKDQRYGICTVISSRRTGHQYDRHNAYEVITPEGMIIDIDDYDLHTGKAEIIEEEKND